MNNSRRKNNSIKSYIYIRATNSKAKVTPLQSNSSEYNSTNSIKLLAYIYAPSYLKMLANC